MAIFEYMNVEDVWTIFFNMNSRFNSLVFDSRLRLTADVSKIDKSNFDNFCLSLINTNFSNIFTLILSNNYYRYPQIRSFLSQTNFTVFQSLHAITLIDINHDELIEVTKQMKELPYLNYFHVNTHEIFYDKELANITRALLDQSNIRVSILCLHEKLQWLETESISSCNAEVLSLDFINADRLFSLLPNCPRLRSLSLTLDPRTKLANITRALLDQSNIRVSILCLHEKLQWLETESISSCNAEVLSLDFINADRLFSLLPNCPRLRSLSLTLDPRTSLPKVSEENLSPTLVLNTFAQITYLRLCFRPFDPSILDRLLNSVPSVRRFSLETLVYNTDYIRSPYWTLLLQSQLPLLERIRLIIRGWFVLKTSNNINNEKFDEASVIDSYRYDRYWLDRAHKRKFHCNVDSYSYTAMLQIR
ncbi:unnamed protein product [Adineta steineri]|uniref:Uncharacterized protein n=1 Tax=Adineta steineri TaxID=433720 RepID=A0A813NSI4_9BILA|nr:unnamed protein product [Adineta steineri]